MENGRQKKGKKLRKEAAERKEREVTIIDVWTVVEHLIEGDYIKYNSNSGFVSEMNRLTPHAFSHFTFEKSQHQLIIVDIQGTLCL